MATWFVKGETGSDSNDGLTPNTPRKTLPASAAVANGDTINCAETVRSSTGNAATFTYTNKSGLTFQQWDGEPTWYMHGGTPAGTGWTEGAASGGGVKWTKTIAGLTISRVAFKYNTSINSLGQHYGVYRSTAAANNLGEYAYAANVVTINIPVGENPNGSAQDVHVAQVNAVLGAIVFQGGSNNTVKGANFRLYPSPSGQFGWGVCFNPCTNGRVISCTADSMGLHAFGTLGGGDCSGCAISGVTHYSSVADSAPIVFYQENASGDLTGCELTDSTIYGSRLLGHDGTVTAGQSDNTQNLVYAHSDAGTPIADVSIRRCNITPLEAGPCPADCANVPAPDDGWVHDDYAFRIDQCNIKVYYWRISQYISRRRCIIDGSQVGPSGQNRNNGNGAFSWAGTNTSTQLWDACAFLIDATDAGQLVRVFATPNAACDLRRLNCSVLNYSAGTEGVLLDTFMGRTDTFIRDRGSILFHSTLSSGGRTICYEDPDATVGGRDYMDNRYGQTNGAAGYSQHANFDTFAEFKALIDTAAGSQLTANPFPNANTSLALTPASALWDQRRSTSAIVPSAGGIDGTYTGRYGAYQHPVLASRTLRAFGPGRRVRRL